MHIKTEENMRACAKEFAKSLNGGEFVALIGDLGAGKTTFTQGLVAGLGSVARVKSPTYTVMNEYVIEGHATITKVVHLDLYRFTTERELGALELESYRKPNVVIIAEWPNAIENVDFKPDITVQIEHVQGGGREVTFS
ncbi:tRNA (adenosine(37)-N6)-threonylcarbamoyltransferase complex ATPase subunit type 1 TsaE [Patescibacteria group bacterium]|nr:tRNA (adenosine(37)-N6)-threonylcarbamoyltransferase complex ATPase subunit type 1 TsaE [Patescibacteria group bacterium]